MPVFQSRLLPKGLETLTELALESWRRSQPDHLAALRNDEAF